MKRGWVVVIVVALVAVAAWWWWRRRAAQTSTSVGDLTVVQTNPKPPTFQGTVEQAGNVTVSSKPIGAVDVSGTSIPVTGPLGVGIPVTYYDGMLIL